MELVKYAVQQPANVSHLLAAMEDLHAFKEKPVIMTASVKKKIMVPHSHKFHDRIY